MKNILTIFILLNGINLFSQLVKPKCLEGNCRNKIGTYIYSDSSIYSGEFTDKMRNGQGKIKYKDGSYYEGTWLLDKRSGTGTYVDSKGNKYDGLWANDKQNELGKLSDAIGNIYTGSWNDGSLLGNVKIQFNNNDVYEGEYANGLNGKGTLTYSDGAVYKGNWNNNMRFSYGEMIFPFGITYKGNWSANEVDGTGEFYETGTQKRLASGNWKTEKTKDGDLKFFNTDGYLICHYVTKDFYYGHTRNGVYNGHGRLVYKNGAYYDGEFSDGKYNGNGHFYNSDKSEYDGEWKDNLKDGYGVLTNTDKSIIKGYWSADKYIGANKRVELATFIQCIESCDEEWNSSTIAYKRLGNCINGIKEGEWKDIDENGRVLRIQNFRNGILEGTQTDYYRNGKIEEIKKYRNGLLEGDKITYREDGKIRYKCKYDKGKLIDTAYNYYTGDERQKYFLRYILVFDTNELHEHAYFSKVFMLHKIIYNINPFERCNVPAKFIGFHQNGVISEQCSVFDRERYGNLSRYDEKGNLIAELLYETLEYVEVFNESKIISGWEIIEGDGLNENSTKKKVIYENQIKKEEVIINEKIDYYQGDAEGSSYDEKMFLENGKIRKIESPFYSYEINYIEKESSNEGIRQRLIQEYEFIRELGDRSDYSSMILYLNIGKFKISGSYTDSKKNKYSFKRCIMNSFMVDSIYSNNILCDVIVLSENNELTITHYFPTGKLKSSCRYIDYNENYCFKISDYNTFVPDGELIGFFDNGKVNMSVLFDKGVIKGKVTLYDQNGYKKEYSANELSETDHELLWDIKNNHHEHNGQK